MKRIYRRYRPTGRSAIALVFTIATCIAALPGIASMDTNATKAFAKATQKGLARGDLLIYVSVANQKLHVVDKSGIRYRYTISTSKFGTGSREHSNRTPLGWHTVADRIGSNAVPGQVFVARSPVAGRVLAKSDWSQPNGQDLVLTRILRLRGMEPGKNSGPGIDSYERFIYVHGTNQEQLLGQPASHGCIRMRNRDVMELFDVIGTNTAWCVIEAQ